MLELDLSEVPQEVRKRLDERMRGEFRREAFEALENQKRIGAFYGANRPRSIDGIGEQTMALDPFIDWYWRLKRGPDVWEDPDFVRWFKREHEEVRVRSMGTKAMVGYQLPFEPHRDSARRVEYTEPGTKRFTKIYRS